MSSRPGESARHVASACPLDCPDACSLDVTVEGDRVIEIGGSRVNAVTQGTESQGEVTVRLSKGGRIVNGVGADTDIIVASAQAYLNGLNKLSYWSSKNRICPETSA